MLIKKWNATTAIIFTALLSYQSNAYANGPTKSPSKQATEHSKPTPNSNKTVKSKLTRNYAQKTSKGPRMPPFLVTTTKAIPTKYIQTITVNGSIHADQGTVLTSAASGEVTEILFKSGTYTPAGKLLVRLDGAISKAQLDSDSSDLRQKQLYYSRAKKLLPHRAISESDYEKAKSNFLSAQAVVEKDQAILKQMNIRAPFSGYLGLNLINVGNYLKAGDPIVSLQQISKLYVQYSVPTNLASAVKIGEKITVIMNNQPNHATQATISAINTQTNSETGTLSIRAEIKDNKSLIPGSFAQVIQPLSGTNQRIQVPQTALNYSSAGAYVFKDINNIAIKAPVQIRIINSGEAIISSGLNPGDIIVNDGSFKLFPGAPIMSINLSQG